MQMPQWYELALALIGSGLAILALVVDNLSRLGSASTKKFLVALDARVAFRQDETVKPGDNLRQLCATAGSFFLTSLAIVDRQPVYIALQVLINVSCLGWYVRIHRVVETSERIKAGVRLVVMILAWGTLEAFSLCNGFHRLGVLGLEALGVAFIIQRPPILRDLLCLLGGLTLCLYASVGLFFQPEQFSHLNWAALNGLYAILGAIAVYNSWTAPATLMEKKLLEKSPE